MSNDLHPDKITGPYTLWVVRRGGWRRLMTHNDLRGTVHIQVLKRPESLFCYSETIPSSTDITCEELVFVLKRCDRGDHPWLRLGEYYYEEV